MKHSESLTYDKSKKQTVTSCLFHANGQSLPQPDSKGFFAGTLPHATVKNNSSNNKLVKLY